MLRVALPIVVYTLTGSAPGTAAAFLVELAPGAILGPWAGRLADRVERRRLMVVVNLLQAAGLTPLLFVTAHSGLTVLYAVILLQSGLSTLFEPAKNALLPTVLPAGRLVSGNALIGLGAAIGRLAGGPLGGLLVAAGDLRTIAVADAATFVLAAGLIAFAPSGQAAADRPVKPASAAVVPSGRRGGFSARVRFALAVTFLDQVGQGIFVVLFIVFVSRRLHGGASEIGLLRGVQAVGAVAAAVALGTVRRAPSPVRLTMAAALVFGVLSLLIWNGPAVTTAAAVYVILFIVVGAPGVVMQTGLISFLQRSSDEGERGRIFGALIVAENCGQAAGIIAAGVLTASVGLMGMLDAQGTLFLLAGGLAAFGLAGHRRSGRPSLRKAVPWTN
jgi:MFS family permease